MNTAVAKNYKVEQKKWYLIDAQDQVLGRLATRIATILMGKHKPTYTRNLDSGASVVVINASKIKMTGNKTEVKVYKRYSGYPGGLKETSFKRKIETDATHPLRAAVKGMLPKSGMGVKSLLKLHINMDANHQNEAQQPEKI